MDYSCGAASLATLLRHQSGIELSEGAVLELLFDEIPKNEIPRVRREGFSLLDLQRVSTRLDFRASGFRIRADALPDIQEPVIVFIRPEGYEHFAVLRGVRAGHVLLADPARGNVSLTLERFIAMWVDEDGTGVVFVAESSSAASSRAGTLESPASLTPMRVVRSHAYGRLRSTSRSAYP